VSAVMTEMDAPATPSAAASSLPAQQSAIATASALAPSSTCARPARQRGRRPARAAPGPG